MPANLTLPVPLVYAFLLVLARVAGVFVFVPLPGMQNRASEMSRIALAVVVTVALFAQWPTINAEHLGIGQLAGWIVVEATLGIAVGLAVSFLIEGIVMAAQLIGLQAGYAYAAVVDPNTQADAGVLMVFAQLTGGMLFFAMGLDREIVRIFARSLETIPPGAFQLTRPMAEQILGLGAGVFTMGLRLALPAVALLALVDIALALLGRINAQLQLITLAFPVKMLAALVLIAAIAVLLPTVFRAYSGGVLGVVKTALIR